MKTLDELVISRNGLWFTAEEVGKAFETLCVMCGEDTGLFCIGDYNKMVEAYKNQGIVHGNTSV